MSTRNRSAPWFLERPSFYRYALELGPGGRGYVEVQAWWSWNMQDWFDRSGNVVQQGSASSFNGTVTRDERFEPAYPDGFTGFIS